jgi:predicted transcriptional regulator
MNKEERGLGMIRSPSFATMALLVALGTFAFLSLAQPMPPSQGDWVITDTVVLEGMNLTVNGSVLVMPAGRLVLINSSLDCDNVTILGGRVELLSTDLALTGSIYSSLNVSGGNYVLKDGSVSSTASNASVHLGPYCHVDGTHISGVRVVKVSGWNTVLSNCTIVNSTGEGIHVNPQDYPTGYIDISHNRILRPAESGIHVILSKYTGEPVLFKMTDNVVVDTGGSGIYFTTYGLEGVQLDLARNRVAGASYHGVFIGLTANELLADLNGTEARDAKMDGLRISMDIRSVISLGLFDITTVNNTGFGFSVFSLDRFTAGLHLERFNASDNGKGGIYLNGCTDARLFDSAVVNPDASMGDYVMDTSDLDVYSTVHGRARASVTGVTASVTCFRRLDLTVVWQDGRPVVNRGVTLEDEESQTILFRLTDGVGWLGIVTVYEWTVDSLDSDIRSTLRAALHGVGWSVVSEAIPLDRDHTATLVIDDDILPVLVVEYPEDDSTQRITTIDIGGKCEDPQTGVALVQVSIDDEPDWDAKEWETAMGRETWTFYFEGLPDGTYNLYVRAFDVAYLATDKYMRAVVRNVTVDTVVPWLTLESPVDGLLTNSTDLIVQGAVEEGASILLDGTPIQVWDGTFAAEVQLVEGSNEVLIEVFDMAGNVNRLMREVILDIVPPVLVLYDVEGGRLLMPPGGCQVRGWTEPVARVTFVVKGDRAGAPVESDGNFTHWLEPVGDGTIVVVRAVDPAGNVASLRVNVKLLDKVPSTSPLRSPGVLGLTFVGLVTFLGVAVAVETVRYSLLVALVPLYARLRRKQVLDNNARYLLHGIIIDNPGIHYRALLRELQLSNGVTTYHLDVLEREGFIRSVRDGRLRRFYSMNVVVPKERRLTPEALCKQIKELVERTPGISQKQVIEELGMSRRVVGYHLKELVSKRVLTASRKGRNTVYKVTKRRTRGAVPTARKGPVGRPSGEEPRD